MYTQLFTEAKVDLEVIKSFLDVTTLPENFIVEFITMLKEKSLADRDLNEVLSNRNLYISILGIGADTTKIVELSKLSHQEVKLIREFLVKSFDEQFSIDEFLMRYSQNAVKVLSELNFLGLGIKSHIKKNRKKLMDVYVEPKFQIWEETLDARLGFETFKNSLHNTVSLKDIFSGDRNTMILGNPGSGKSVLVRYLICNILEKTCSNLITDEDIPSRIPIRIELRKYFQYKRNTSTGLLKYILNVFESDYGLINLTAKNIEFLLTNRRILMFFDGLDEIFNAADKIEITNDITFLLAAYSNIKAVVTSRIIGYEEAKLPSKLFVEMKILNFNDSQIEDYTNKWYVQEEADAETRLREVKQFLQLYRQIDEELIRNPLLLSLIIILFRNNLKLPESKLEIYQSCTKTLVDKWDLTKELKVELPDEIAKRKETLFADLAFWQYERLSGDNVKITNNLATDRIAESIFGKLKLVDDWIVAQQLAEDFLNYALKRSLYFDNNFTHKTFLEYFTAYWIYSNVEKKYKIEERNAIIFKYIDVPFWSIVLELLFNMIDQDQADTEIIDNLYAYHMEAKPSGLPFLLDSTSFIKNISPTTIANLVDATINHLINGLVRKQRKADREQRHFQALISFINSNDIQLSTFRSKFLKFTKTSADENTLKYLTLLYLELSNHYLNKSLTFDENDFYDWSQSEKLISTDQDLFAMNLLVRRPLQDKGNLTSALEHFPNIIFSPQPSAFEKQYVSSGLFAIYLYELISKSLYRQIIEDMEFLFSRGLRKDHFFKFLSTDRFYFFIRDPVDIQEIKSILDYITSTSPDPLIVLLLLYILWSIRNSSQDKNSFDQYVSESDLKFDLKSFSKASYKDVFPMFVESLRLNSYQLVSGPSAL